jgi:membrane-bound lytic murein transglycosylase B
MEPIFERIFGGKDAMRLWFANLIMYSVVLTEVESHFPFTDIGSAVMKMLADTRSIRIGVKRHKSAPQAYAYVEKEFGVKPSLLCCMPHMGHAPGLWPPAGKQCW